MDRGIKELSRKAQPKLNWLANVGVNEVICLDLYSYKRKKMLTNVNPNLCSMSLNSKPSLFFLISFCGGISSERSQCGIPQCNALGHIHTTVISMPRWTVYNLTVVVLKRVILVVARGTWGEGSKSQLDLCTYSLCVCKHRVVFTDQSLSSTALHLYYYVVLPSIYVSYTYSRYIYKYKEREINIWWLHLTGRNTKNIVVL